MPSSLPPEVIEQILLKLGTEDVKACSLTGKSLGDEASRLLWRALCISPDGGDGTSGQSVHPMTDFASALLKSPHKASHVRRISFKRKQKEAWHFRPPLPPPSSPFFESSAQEEEMEGAFRLLSDLVFVEISASESETWFLRHFGPLLERALRDCAILSFITTSRLPEVAPLISAWSLSLRAVCFTALESAFPSPSEADARSGGSHTEHTPVDDIIPNLPSLQELHFVDPNLIPIFASHAPALISVVQISPSLPTGFILEPPTSSPTAQSYVPMPPLLKNVQTSLSSLSSLKRVRISVFFRNWAVLSRATLFLISAHPTLEALELLFMYYPLGERHDVHVSWVINPLISAPDKSLPDARSGPHVPPSVSFTALLPTLRYLRITFFDQEFLSGDYGNDVDELAPEDEEEMEASRQTTRDKMRDSLLSSLRHEFELQPHRNGRTGTSALRRVELMYPARQPIGPPGPPEDSGIVLVASRSAPSSTIGTMSNAPSPSMGDAAGDLNDGMWRTHKERKEFNPWTSADDANWNSNFNFKDAGW
ncbi:hypothetical protein DL93DRAFT_2167833 [Clavulina sp. PMI_390]|nr:hypothetical protein DL93DRAFT_2167833 [Clavulina sp. PMI_390]